MRARNISFFFQPSLGLRYVSHYNVFYEEFGLDETDYYMTYTDYVFWRMRNAYVDALFRSEGTDWIFGMHLATISEKANSQWLNTATEDSAIALKETRGFDCSVSYITNVIHFYTKGSVFETFLFACFC